MPNIFQYSIIRYRPFSETGEFANIGVIVLNEDLGIIDYELAPKRFARVKHFFDNSAYESYSSVIDTLRIELPRISDYLILTRGHSSRVVFDEITKQRESSVIYSGHRSIISELDIRSVVEKLFSRYVRRDFAVQENSEVVLTRDIKRLLNDNGIKHFKPLRIDDEVVPINFPLANNDGHFYAIKPLSFSQKNPISIFDYGAHWTQRLSYLLSRNKIDRDSILIAADPPKPEEDQSMFDAYYLARKELSQLPFKIVEASSHGQNVRDDIIDFARRAVPRQHYF